MTRDVKDLIVALDIGTTKVVAVVAEALPDGGFRRCRVSAGIDIGGRDFGSLPTADSSARENDLRRRQLR